MKQNPVTIPFMQMKPPCMCRDTHVGTLGHPAGLTFSFENARVKHRYLVTLDLNKPSFQRSASTPSAVCATCTKRQRGKKEREKEREGLSEEGRQGPASLKASTGPRAN